MEMQASRQLRVTQQQAWDSLNDPKVLQVCIPGCEKIESSAADQYVVGVAVKIGPVSAKFNGKIRLGEIHAPNSYTISFDGQGGAAGFGKGTAKVALAPRENGCELSYTVHAQVGGKIAQLGQRLVDGAAKGMAEDFFRRFDDEMQRLYPPVDAGEQPIAPVAVAATAKKVPVWVWAAGGMLLLLAWWLSR